MLCCCACVQEQALDREVEEILAERKRVKELLVGWWWASHAGSGRGEGRGTARLQAAAAAGAGRSGCGQPAAELSGSCVAVQDEAYSRVSELKSMQKAKNDEFYGNRRFSRSIREVGGQRGEHGQHQKAMGGLCLWGRCCAAAWLC